MEEMCYQSFVLVELLCHLLSFRMFRIVVVHRLNDDLNVILEVVGTEGCFA